MPATKIDFRDRLGWLGLCGLLYILFYKGSGFWAQSRGSMGHLDLPWESSMPFLNWMIVPYLSCVPIFGLMFLICTERREFMLMVKRLLFVTIAGTLIHVLFPFSFAFTKPEVGSPVYRFMFDILVVLDIPFNQSPSLHVCLAIIYWSVISWVVKERLLRMVLKFWILAVAISTIFVYQHHIIDVFSACVLSCVANIFFNRGRNALIGNVYLLGASLLGLFWIRDVRAFILLWVALNLVVVGTAYIKENPFLMKRRNGSLRLGVALFLAPYLAFYLLSRFVFRSKKTSLVQEVYPRLYAGAWMSGGQVSALFPLENLVVYDLSAELPESRMVRAKALRYVYYPFLDISKYDYCELVNEIVQSYKDGIVVYIHCTMGYSRSQKVAQEVINKLKER